MAGEQQVDTLDVPEDEIPTEAPLESTDDSGGDDAPALTPELLERAKEFGLGADDVAGFDAPRLEGMFAAIDRRTMGAPVTAPGAVQTPQQPQPQTAPAAEEFKPFALELSDDIDESVSGPLRSIVEHINAQLKDVHVFRQQALGELQAINTLRNIADFDRFIGSLGDEWTEQYGQGPTLDLDPQSKAFQKRMEVYTGADGLVSSSAQRGVNMRRGDGWLRSHRATHWDQIAQLERKKLGSKIDSRKRQFGERPGKGKQPSMTPREEALAAFTK